MMNDGLEIGSEDRSTHKMINRDIEEALDLGSMEIHGENSVCAGCGKHICNNFCGDRVTGFCFSVLTCISEIGHYCGDSSCGCTFERIDHNDEFHEVVVNGVAGGLDDENIGSADGFLKGNAYFTVCEMAYGAFSYRKSEAFCNFFSCFGISITAENFNVFAVNVHFLISPVFLFYIC